MTPPGSSGETAPETELGYDEDASAQDVIDAIPMTADSNLQPSIAMLERQDEVLRSERFDRLTVRQARLLIDSDRSLERVPVTRRFYFGCFGESGHYFWTTERKRVVKLRHEALTGPEGLPWKRVDGALTPSGPQAQGEALLHHGNGWTALAFWDRSVDSRGGSNSVFFFDSRLTFDEALADAQEHFPQIFARFDFPIVDVTHA